MYKHSELTKESQENFKYTLLVAVLCDYNYIASLKTNATEDRKVIFLCSCAY